MQIDGKQKKSIEFFSAVVLTSKDPERLANFYRDVIGIPLEDEQHGESLKHYGCELGDLHFAIHPVEIFENTNYGTGSVKLAFTIFDMNAFVEQMRSRDVKLAYEPRDMGFALMTALTDPDGNYVEFTQLSDGWFKHLEKRKIEGHDVVASWKEMKRQPTCANYVP